MLIRCDVILQKGPHIIPFVLLCWFYASIKTRLPIKSVKSISYLIAIDMRMIYSRKNNIFVRALSEIRDKERERE